MKFLWLLLLAIVAWRLLLGRWPWQRRGHAVRARARARARDLLGTGPKASRREIVEAHRRLVAMVHPDRGGSNEEVHEANAARDILLADLPHHQEQT